MNVVVAGMGEVGRHITKVLAGEGHNLTVVDSDHEALAYAEESFDVMAMRGHAASMEVFRQIDMQACDLFVAVTSNSGVNIIAALRARELGAKRTIARASEQAFFEDERGLVTGMLGIDLVINPRTLTAREIHKIVRSVATISVEDFADNRIEVIQLAITRDTRRLGNSLKTLDLPSGTLVVAIVRDEELIIPSGEDWFEVGDEAYVVGMTDRMNEVEHLFGHKRRHFTRRAMIVGGGSIGISLARTLENDGVEVIVIERDQKRCQELSNELSRAIIINGDGTNAHLLEEEGVDVADVFIAVSMEDEVNLMASLLAKNLGAKRCVALVHKPDYMPVCERLGVNVAISPRLLVAKEVLKYVREGEILSSSSIMGGLGEFLEFVVPADARITGLPLKDVNFPRGAVVCAGLGRKGTYIPRGDRQLEAGDRVVVFTRPKVRSDVLRLFKKPLFALR